MVLQGKTKTLRSSPNADIRAMYKGVMDQTCIIMFCGSIGYTIGSPSKFYEDNQATIR